MRAVTVTVPMPEVAETPVATVCSVVLALIAVARLLATCVVVAAAAPDQYANVGGFDVPEVTPSAPPLRSAPGHKRSEKLVSEVAMVFPVDPCVRAVSVTTLLVPPPLEAEAPAPPSRVVLALIAVTRLVATCVAVAAALTDQYANVGGVDVPDVTPSEPPLRSIEDVPFDQVKVDVPKVDVRAMLFPPDPAVTALTVTVPPLFVAFTPIASGQSVIAAARSAASFVARLPPVVTEVKVPV